MRPRISSVCWSACSWVSFSFLTSPPIWPAVTLRASVMPASTNYCLTSLSTTSNPAAAIVWAIWPPMVPAPTTAALNTNMVSGQLLVALKVGGRPHLAPEAREGALERVAHRAPHEQEVDYSRNAAVLLYGVVQLEGHGGPVGARAEADRLAAVDLLVLDLDRLADARLEADDALKHAPAAAGLGVPDDDGAWLARPPVVDLEHVPQAVDERRPADGVVPQLLGVRGDLHRGVRGEALGMRGLQRVALALVEQHGAVPGGQARQVHLRRHVGDHELDRLVHRDRDAELDALLGVLGGELERGARDAGRHRGDARARAVEGHHRELEALVLLGQEVLGVDL